MSVDTRSFLFISNFYSSKTACILHRPYGNFSVNPKHKKIYASNLNKFPFLYILLRSGNMLNIVWKDSTNFLWVIWDTTQNHECELFLKIMCLMFHPMHTLRIFREDLFELVLHFIDSNQWRIRKCRLCIIYTHYCNRIHVYKCVKCSETQYHMFVTTDFRNFRRAQVIDSKKQNYLFSMRC